MELGFVCLGDTDSSIRERLRERGIRVVEHDPDSARNDMDSLAKLVDGLRAPRAVWVSMPAGAPTRRIIGQLSHLLDRDDLVIDGGTSRFTDDVVNARVLAERGIRYLDCGVSMSNSGRGGGCAVMAGGSARDVETMMPIFDALTPDGPRTASLAHVGPTGAGHYAKMIHDGIESGVLQAFAEGYELLTAGDCVIDAAAVLRGWTAGSALDSRVLDTLVGALSVDPGLQSAYDGCAPAEDSVADRWAVEEALTRAVAAPVMTAAVLARFGPARDESPTRKALTALRRPLRRQAARHPRPLRLA